MLNQEHLEEIIGSVIQATAQEAMENQDDQIVHLDYEVTQIDPPQRLEGRNGVFIKIGFVYELEALSSGDLEDETGLQTFRQTIRLNPEGQVVAYSDRSEVLA